MVYRFYYMALFHSQTRRHMIKDIYGKCCKISYTFLFLFSNKMLVIRDGDHKILGLIAKREHPEQASEAV